MASAPSGVSAPEAPAPQPNFGNSAAPVSHGAAAEGLVQDPAEPRDRYPNSVRLE